jgi:bile acid-coenzyme A ligase
LIPVSYGKRLGQLATEKGNQTALLFAHESGVERSVSFSELESRSNQVARMLQARGVAEDSLIVLAIQNSPELVIAAFATWKLGGCVLTLNPRLADRERRETLDAASDSGRRLFIINGSEKDGDLAVDALTEASAFSNAPLPDRVAQPGKAIGSGGSTGRSKIIVDPRPWVAVPMVPGSSDPFGRRVEHTILIGGPLYHNGPFGPVFSSLFDGSTVVLMQRFIASAAVDLIERHHVGWTYMVPTQMARIARLPDIDQRELGSLEGLYHGGAFCADWLKRKWIRLIGAEHVYEIYGSAEQHGVTYIRGDEWLRHPGSVGRGLAVDIRILDGRGQSLSTGEVGEVYLRWKPDAEAGFLAPKADLASMCIYWGSEPMKSTSDGFGSSGDLGWLDEGGYLYLADRRLDLIVTGGSNVYPAEVEAVIGEHPGVDDVVVIGLPDDDWGHRVHAVVQVSSANGPTATELDALCRDRLSHYKVPKEYEFVRLLPRDESGKIRRSQVRAERLAGVQTPGGG